MPLPMIMVGPQPDIRQTVQNMCLHCAQLCFPSVIGSGIFHVLFAWLRRLPCAMFGFDLFLAMVVWVEGERWLNMEHLLYIAEVLCMCVYVCCLLVSGWGWGVAIGRYKLGELLTLCMCMIALNCTLGCLCVSATVRLTFALWSCGYNCFVLHLLCLCL